MKKETTQSEISLTKHDAFHTPPKKKSCKFACFWPIKIGHVSSWDAWTHVEWVGWVRNRLRWGAEQRIM